MSDSGATAIAVAEAMRHLGNGEMASLRRLGPDVVAPAFWRLAVQHGVRDDREWVAIIRALAILTPKGPPGERPRLHDAHRKFGEALCDGGDPTWPQTRPPRPAVSERRLAQILAARSGQRTVLLTRAVRALAARRDSARGLDVADFAWAFLSPENHGAIARPYYRRLDQATRQAEKEHEGEDAHG